MIDAECDNVVVKWWERNQISDEPDARISTNAVETFEPLLQLLQNGTIGNDGNIN
jgi:hypothetical protein